MHLLKFKGFKLILPACGGPRFGLQQPQGCPLRNMFICIANHWSQMPFQRRPIFGQPRQARDSGRADEGIGILRRALKDGQIFLAFPLAKTVNGSRAPGGIRRIQQPGDDSIGARMSRKQRPIFSFARQQ